VADYHPYLFTREKTVSKKLGKVFHREIGLPGLKAVSDSPGWKTWGEIFLACSLALVCSILGIHGHNFDEKFCRRISWQQEHPQQILQRQSHKNFRVFNLAPD
jgi:hypothetical protein